MPQYFSPGVYVEEVDSGPRPIEGVSTSVAAMVGITQIGPSDGPELVTSFAEFMRKFGPHWSEKQRTEFEKTAVFPISDKGRIGALPNAAEGFFANGGQQLYVSRVKTTGGAKGKAELKDGATVLITLSAIEEGTWINESKVNLSVTASKKTRSSSDAAGSKVKLNDVAGLYESARIELTKPDGSESVIRKVKSVDVEQLEVEFTSAIPAGYGTGSTATLIELAIEIHDPVFGRTEKFENLRPNGEGNQAIKKVLENSQIISATGGEIPLTSKIENAEVDFADGVDSLTNLSPEDYVGKDLPARTGIKSLEDVDDISIAIVPGMWDSTITQPLLEHCELMRYRVAIVDPPVESAIEEVKLFRDNFDSKYGALYYPWVKARQTGIKEDILIPPSGHMAGIYADVDTRRGYHKAPANEVINGVTGIERVVNKREQDSLNPKGVNALRFFPGRGNRVWGARTISTSDTNFKYINVRRIFNFIERSIDEGTQWVVFEPNNAELWSRVRQSVNNFLNTQWRAGALEGAKPEDAYFVACDRGTTMTQDDIENGRLIVEVGIAPVYPAEFVIFKVQKYVAASKLA